MLSFIENAFHKTENNSAQEKYKITLNVYDMLRPGFITSVGFILGVGIYHSGVEIDNQEYCFGGHDFENITGVFTAKPRVGPQGILFKKSINMGYTDLTKEEIDKILQEVSKEYLGTSYKLLTRNCNHFSDDLCKRLTGKSAPGWINRAARLGTMFPCVIPTEWVEPPDANENVTMVKTSGSNSSTHSTSKSKNSKIDIKKETIELTRQVSNSMDNIRFNKKPNIEKEEIHQYKPIKEPNTFTSDVILSNTRLTITTPCS